MGSPFQVFSIELLEWGRTFSALVTGKNKVYVSLVPSPLSALNVNNNALTNREPMKLDQQRSHMIILPFTQN